MAAVIVIQIVVGQGNAIRILPGYDGVVIICNLVSVQIVIALCHTARELFYKLPVCPSAIACPKNNHAANADIRFYVFLKLCIITVSGKGLVICEHNNRIFG